MVSETILAVKTKKKTLSHVLGDSISGGLRRAGFCFVGRYAVAPHCCACHM